MPNTLLALLAGSCIHALAQNFQIIGYITYSKIPFFVDV